MVVMEEVEEEGLWKRQGRNQDGWRTFGDGSWRGSTEMEEGDGWRSVERDDRRGWWCCVPAAAAAVAAA